jgi:hypothetical protein
MPTTIQTGSIRGRDESLAIIQAELSRLDPLTLALFADGIVAELRADPPPDEEPLRSANPPPCSGATKPLRAGS